MAGTENQHAARRDRHFIAGLGIAAHALRFWRTAKRSEGGQLHRLAVRERGAKFSEHVFDHLGQVMARQTHSLENSFGQIGACQRRRCHGGIATPLTLTQR